MTLTPGSRLGPYEVVAPLGAGGMGEVYRARDTRLERQVAIKVLPAELSNNVQLRLRFEQEAKTISALNHPHVCTLHDVGHENGVDFLVMEYCEGETLAQRLTRGPLPVEQALRCGIEITEALGKAHRQGIIHRDLKPGNIMLTKSGAKLLDFGLAKYRHPTEQPTIGLSAMPTDHHPLTAEGTILGTFQYMAPEQLEGREADARTDIFALGAVLYEMATGKRAFEGKSKASLIASILDRDPAPISSIQPMTPPALERVVKTCLAKDPDDRWQTAHDVMLELKWVAESSSAGLAAPLAVRRRQWERLSWATALAAVAAAAIFATLWFRATQQKPPVVYSSILPPETTQFAFDSGPMALSPDGRKIAFVAKAADGKDLLHVRSLNASNAQALAGTEGATHPFWSPDGRFLGFFAGGKLRKVEASGGAPQTLSEAPIGRGGSWNRQGVILFVPNTRSGVHKVSSAGGTSTAVTRLESARQEFSHRWPVFLPDERHFLYLAQSAFGPSAEENVIYAGSLDSDQRVELVRANSSVAFFPPRSLIFWRDRALLAQPFDPEELKMTGEPFPIAEDVQHVSSTASAIFSVSHQGTLAYQAGSGLGLSRLGWFDRSGKEIEVIEPAEDYRNPHISRDGRRLVVEKIALAGKADLWIYDLPRKVWTRFTFDPANESSPHWSPDGNRVLFSSNRKRFGDLFWKISTGSGNDESFLENTAFKVANDWSEDGRVILFAAHDTGKTQWDLWAYSVPERKAWPVLQTEFSEYDAKFSPDGKWITYVSTESGSPQIYVQPFPGPGGKWQISTAGGLQPRWSRDGREIFFVTPDRKLMSVEARGSPNFEAGIPRALFELRLKGGIEVAYDVTADGKRFLINNSVAPAVNHPMTLVQNWTAELKQ